MPTTINDGISSMYESGRFVSVLWAGVYRAAWRVLLYYRTVHGVVDGLAFWLCCFGLI